MIRAVPRSNGVPQAKATTRWIGKRAMRPNGPRSSAARQAPILRMIHPNRNRSPRPSARCSSAGLIRGNGKRDDGTYGINGINGKYPLVSVYSVYSVCSVVSLPRAAQYARNARASSIAVRAPASLAPSRRKRSKRSAICVHAPFVSPLSTNRFSYSHSASSEVNGSTSRA
jgi:hypothetical protein